MKYIVTDGSIDVYETNDYEEAQNILEDSFDLGLDLEIVEEED